MPAERLAASAESTSDTGRWHQFFSDGNSWAVARRTATQAHHTGLCFRRGRKTRLLVFTRGTLPSDRELDSMGEEVLDVLLRRAVG